MTFLLAYATLSAGFLTYSLFHLLVAERGRQKRLEGADLIVLGGVGLLSSAAWPLLVPVYAYGWVRSGGGRRLRARLRSVARPLGAASEPRGHPRSVGAEPLRAG